MVCEEELWRHNPWWRSPSAIDKDDKIIEWSESTIRHDPGLRRAIRYDFGPGNTVVYTLRGPRQAGKTTLMKLQIRDFLKEGRNPWSIMYYSLGLAEAPRDVVDAVGGYLRISSRHREGRAYVFLDEASSIKNWQKGIKYMVDAGMLSDCTVMAASSQTTGMERASERMPGRRGDAGGSLDHVLLPARFSEYARMCSPRVREFVEGIAQYDATRRRALEGLAEGRIDGIVDGMHALMDELGFLLERYMITGGTPKIVGEYARSGSVPDELYRAYLEGVAGQCEDAGFDKDTMRQVSGALIKAAGGRVSWRALSGGGGLGAPAAKRCVELLGGLFVLSVVHRYGHDKGVPMMGKERKIYFTDPFFMHMLNAWTGGGGFLESVRHRDGAGGPIAEGIVASHLTRWAFDVSAQKLSFDPHNHVFYWVDDKGREVDFVYAGGGMRLPVEVKYRSRIRHTELAPLARFLDATGAKAGLVLSKDTLDLRQDYAVVPACVFLMLI